MVTSLIHYVSVVNGLNGSASNCDPSLILDGNLFALPIFTWFRNNTDPVQLHDSSRVGSQEPLIGL